MLLKPCWTDPIGQEVVNVPSFLSRAERLSAGHVLSLAAGYATALAACGYRWGREMSPLARRGTGRTWSDLVPSL